MCDNSIAMSTINYLSDILSDSFDITAPTPTTTFNLPNSCSNSSSSTQEQVTTFGLDQKYDVTASQYSSSGDIFQQPSQVQCTSFAYPQPQTFAVQNLNNLPYASSSCSVSNEPSASASSQLSSVPDGDSNLPVTATAATITDIPFSFFNSPVATDTNLIDDSSGSKVSATFNQLPSKWLINENPLDLSDVFDDFDLTGLKKVILPVSNLEPSTSSQRSSGLYLNNKRVSKTKPKTITVVDLTNDDAEHTYEVSVSESGSAVSSATSISTNTNAGSTNHQAGLLPPLRNGSTPAVQSADNATSNSSSGFYPPLPGHALPIDASFVAPVPSSSTSQSFNSPSSSFDTSSTSSSVVNTVPKLRIRTKTELFEQTQPSLMDMIDAYLPSRVATSSQPQNVANQIPTSNNQSIVQPSVNTSFDWPSRQSTSSYPQTTSSGLQSSQISTTSSVTNSIFGETTRAPPSYSASVSNTLYGVNLLNASLLQTPNATLPSRTSTRRRIWEKPYTTSQSAIRRKPKSKPSASPAVAHTGTITSTYQPQNLYPAASISRTNTDPASSSYHLRSLLATNTNPNSGLRLGFPSCSRLSNNNFVTPRYPWWPPTSDANLPYLSKPPASQYLTPSHLLNAGSNASAQTASATFSNNSTASSLHQPFIGIASSTSVYPTNTVPSQSLSSNTSQDLFNPSLTNAVPSSITSPNQNFTIYANKVNIQNTAGQETAPMTIGVKKQTSNMLPGKNDNDDDGECVVCLERSASMVLYKCGHACLCQICVVKVQREGSKCPICRNVFVDAIRLYKI